MKRLNNKRGMTMAEVLIVMAIIAVLGGVAFIAVNRYQRSMGQLERDGIAKEIFVAAQNHLTVAIGENYMGATDDSAFGQKDEFAKDKSGQDIKDDYYFVVNRGVVTGDGADIFEQMLPFGSVDETVRLGGSYIVHYQKDMGLVLDVFYCSLSGSPDVFNHTLKIGEYETVLGMRDTDTASHKAARRNWNGAILGWYGGTEAANLERIKLEAPTIEIRNAETLSVTVKDAAANSGKGASLRLIIRGVSSGKEHYLDVDMGQVEQTFILDDITYKNGHFYARSFDDMGVTADNSGFIPGENLLIRAVAYSKDKYANLAYSAEKTTNSLYADGSTEKTAYIGNIRHLENLDRGISKLGANDDNTNPALQIAAAVQIRDLNWTADDGSYWAGRSVVDQQTTEYSTETGKYYPVSPDYELSYNGQENSVCNLDINYPGSAGMFGTLDEVNGDIEIKNVIVRNSLEDDSALEIKGGSAGGLVGSMTGGSITNCAAAVYVNGGDAGGLIGSANGVEVKDSYSGGHTKDGKYLPTAEAGAAARVNVIATGSAGGLIGSMTGGSAENCYSTCSVKGATAEGTAAGGFVGTASGTVSNSYCTGLVLGPGDVVATSAVKAFVGKDNGVTASGCWYESAFNAAHYSARKAELKAANISGADQLVEDLAAGCANAFPFDKDRVENGTLVFAFDAYKAFRSPDLAPDEAEPYDEYLTNHYKGSGQTDYPLKTIKQLHSSAPDFLAVHYGDWPAPEILVVNPRT